MTAALFKRRVVPRGPPAAAPAPAGEGAAPALARATLDAAERCRHRPPAPHRRRRLALHRPLRRRAHGARDLARPARDPPRSRRRRRKTCWRCSASCTSTNCCRLTAPADVGSLAQRRDATRRRRRAWLNPFAFRLPLGDPSRLLAWFDPLGRALLRPGIGLLWLLALLATAVAAGSEWAALRAHAALFLASPLALAALWLVYPPMKALHELGHALVVRRFGGEVHEAGIGLMLLLPAPYVDASAASAFTRRRQRALVGRGRRRRGADALDARLLGLAGHPARPPARPRADGDDPRRRVHPAVQRQPAAALRRLPRAVRRRRPAQPGRPQRRLVAARAVAPAAGAAASRRRRTRRANAPG